ncbi:MAG TPA: GNAT family N-acetyltransferase [Thermoplasmata archaeon]|nr:GNAT family N-acetyltransferase [Thermoplasmata archaeon]
MWTTRRATPADVPALRELCLAAVGTDDYVPHFLDRFVRDATTLVATDVARIVGMMVADDTPDGGVWLRAARTHPEVRRRGVATALNRACEDIARLRGRACLRLWAEARNTASVEAARRCGFRDRARFTRMRIRAAPTALEVSLEPLDPERDGPLLETSPFLRRSSGYVFHDFYFIPLTRANARWLAAAGALWRFGPNAVAISEDFEDLRGKDLQVQLLAGDAATVLRAAPAVARARGADRVESFLPHEPELLDTAKAVGFEPMEWGQEAILLEKRLVP